MIYESIVCIILLLLVAAILILISVAFYLDLFVRYRIDNKINSDYTEALSRSLTLNEFGRLLVKLFETR